MKKETAVQCMVLLSFPSQTRGDVEAVAIGHRDGTVSILDIETGEQLAIIEASTSNVRDPANSLLEEASFVSIESKHGILATCTNLGQARFTKISTLWSKDKKTVTTEFELPAPINSMRLHPEKEGVIAFGGKENDLQVWSSTQSLIDSDDEEEEDLWNTFTPFWKAKNVKNDELDLRVPIWISDIQFLQSDFAQEGFRLLTSTRHRQLRIYHTKAARRPIRSVELSEHPLSQLLTTNPERTEAIFTDSHANIMHINLSKLAVIGSYKGFSGAVATIFVNEANGILVAGGIDASLRAYSVTGHQQLCSVHLGSRINHCASLLDLTSIKVEDDLSDEEEDVWQGLEEVETREKKRVRRS